MRSPIPSELSAERSPRSESAGAQALSGSIVPRNGMATAQRARMRELVVVSLLLSVAGVVTNA